MEVSKSTWVTQMMVLPLQQYLMKMNKRNPINKNKLLALGASKLYTTQVSATASY